MTRYVIDAPALLHLAAGHVEVHPDHRLVAPSLVRSQALTLLLEAAARGELTDAEAMDRHRAFTEVKIRLLGDRVSRQTAWKIAREHGWETTYDAEYLAVTRLQADALVALDPGLAERAEGVVPLASVEDLARG